MRLRLGGGEAGGRLLHSGRGLSTRPTPAGVREALVNILRERLAGAVALDLFAGFGTVGLELLSWGAARATFVERDRQALACLRRNIAELGWGARATILAQPVATALGSLTDAGQRFDIIFVDPPYERGLVAATLAHLALAPQLLAAGGVLVIQHSRREAVAAPASWRVVRQRTGGETSLTFLEREPA